MDVEFLGFTKQTMTNLTIRPFQNSLIPDAANLFVENYRKERLATSVLPALMENPVWVAQKLTALMATCSGVAVLKDGQLVGYLGWFLVNGFRGTGRKGAYVPEWGHVCVEENKPTIYQAMYRAAAEEWAEAGCQVHALTLLAHDHTAEKAWYWNGFGLTVVDAIRPSQPLDISEPTHLTIRKATSQDAISLTELDAEHWTHYPRSPVFMAPATGRDADANVAFLSRPKNSVWMAFDGEVPAGFIRFEGYDFDSVAILETEEGVQITGAYVRPAYRGQKVAVALLDTALRAYQAHGLQYCAVNFESFNPEATAFWMKYFEPVCFSVVRVPEYLP